MLPGSMPAPDHSFTPKEVADQIDRSPRYVREQCRSGVIKTFPVGTPYRIPRSELKRLTLDASDALPADRNRR